MRAAWLLLLLLLPSRIWAQTLDDPSQFEPYINEPIAEITLTGNNITRTHVITRELTVKIGDPLTLDAVKESVRNLMNLDIFSSITVTPTRVDDGIALDFAVREMPWIIPYIKFKYNEENGWSVGPTVSSLNFLGRDIQLSAFWLFGGTNTFSFIGSWPWITGNHLSLELTLQHLIRDDTLNKFEEDSYIFQPIIGTFLDKHGRLFGSFTWFQMNSDSTGRTLDPDNRDNLYSLGGSIGWDSRDSWNDPHRGWHNELVVEKTGDPLPGNGDYWRFILDLRRYQPLAERHTLAVGALTSLNSGTVGVDYPEYLMYRMGGANSIRGYLLDDLGPILFGQNQIILTVEYQWQIMPFREYTVWKWPFRAGLQAAAFADWGNAWNEGQSLRDRGKAGFGIGLRPLVPAVNMIRFDLGVSEDGDFVFNFGINPKFIAQRERLR
jgi:outer membrane protein insertion porin family